jgi:hypothetical protein
MVLVLVIVFRTSTYSATAESHGERPRADPLTLRLTISVGSPAGRDRLG